MYSTKHPVVRTSETRFAGNRFRINGHHMEDRSSVTIPVISMYAFLVNLYADCTVVEIKKMTLYIMGRW